MERRSVNGKWCVLNNRITIFKSYGGGVSLYLPAEIRLSLHISFLLLPVMIFCFLYWSSYSGRPFITICKFTALATSALVIALIIHESAHLFAARLSGIKETNHIVLHGLGGFCLFAEEIDEKPAKIQLAVFSAGCVTNLLTALLLWRISIYTCCHCKKLLSLLIFYNVLIGLQNLLPVFPLDGGRIFNALMQVIFPKLSIKKKNWCLKAAATVIALPIGVFAIYEKSTVLGLETAFIYGVSLWLCTEEESTECGKWEENAK